MSEIGSRGALNKIERQRRIERVYASIVSSHCAPSMRMIVRDLHDLSKGQIERSVRELRDRGLLVTVTYPTDRRVTCYRPVGAL